MTDPCAHPGAAARVAGGGALPILGSGRGKENAPAARAAIADWLPDFQSGPGVVRAPDTRIEAATGASAPLFSPGQRHSPNSSPARPDPQEGMARRRNQVGGSSFTATIRPRTRPPETEAPRGGVCGGYRRRRKIALFVAVTSEGFAMRLRRAPRPRSRPARATC